MPDVVREALERLARKINSNSSISIEPIAADSWIVSSALQKSIRRGESEIAQRAALTLLNLRGPAILRRFMVIAFEDIGAGDSDTLIAIVSACSDAGWRKTCGGDARAAAGVATVLAEAPKDRTADHLVGAKDHWALAAFAQTTASATVDAKLASVRNEALSLQQRAIATLLTCGDEISAQSKAGVDLLLASYCKLGAPEELLAATAIAAVRTREPITLMVPLIWLTVRNSRVVVISECPVPPLVTKGDIPLFALDEHTRLGREAIWRFARENEDVRTCLEQFVPAAQRRRAANVAAFYVDAAPVAKRLIWDQSATLETFGTERDLMYAGVATEGIGPLLEAIRANLGHLNQLRADVLGRPRPTGRPSGLVAS